MISVRLVVCLILVGCHAAHPSAKVLAGPQIIFHVGSPAGGIRHVSASVDWALPAGCELTSVRVGATKSTGEFYSAFAQWGYDESGNESGWAVGTVMVPAGDYFVEVTLYYEDATGHPRTYTLEVASAVTATAN